MRWIILTDMRFKTLALTCTFLLTACTSPMPIPPTVKPISPIATSIPLTQTPTPTVHAFATPPPTPISPPINFSITIQKFQSVNDGYILYGSYQRTSTSDINFVYLDDVAIRDANGNPIPNEHADASGVLSPDNKSLPFAFKITGKNYTFPLSISVRSINAILPDTATFQFDAGTNPQVGDEWMLNLDVPINVYHIFVHKIKLISGSTPTELGFLFTVWVGPNININNLLITDLNESSNIYGGSGGAEITLGEIENAWALEGYSPAGVKTFQISNLNIKISGDWQTTWQP